MDGGRTARGDPARDECDGEERRRRDRQRHRIHRTDAIEQPPARTRRSPATFVHATRSTSSTLPKTNQSRCEMGPTIESRSDWTWGAMCAPCQVAGDAPPWTKSPTWGSTRARSTDSNGRLVYLRGAEVAIVEAPGGDTVERQRLALVEQDGGVGLVHRRAPRVANGMRQPHQAVRFRVRQRREQDTVHQAEHGRRRADAEREHQDHRSSEDRGAPKAARRKAELGPGESLA